MISCLLILRSGLFSISTNLTKVNIKKRVYLHQGDRSLRLRKIAALYAIIIGIAMMGMWITFLATEQVPEITTAPVTLTYHLLAEFLTAILLLIGGFGLYTNRGWGFHLYLISIGMLLYTVIVSAGYYGNLGDTIMVGMFSIFQILTAFFIGLSFYKWRELKEK